MAPGVILIGMMLAASPSEKTSDLPQRVSACLDALKYLDGSSFAQALAGVRGHCGPLFTRDACAEQFRRFYGSTGKRSTLVALHEGCRRAYCQDLGDVCSTRAQEDPRVLSAQWPSLLQAILALEVGADAAGRIIDALGAVSWPDTGRRGPAPSVVRLSGRQGSVRLELLLADKVVGTWKLGDEPAAHDLDAALDLLYQQRPRDFDVQVETTREVLFMHLKMLMASLHARGFLTLSLVLVESPPPESAR